MATLLIAGAAVASSAPADAATSVVFSYFVDVACPTATSCFAVGNAYASPSGFTKTLVEHWNGKKWSIMPTPNVANPSQLGGSFLNDVACASPMSCFVVGYSATMKGGRLPTRPFVAHWNGKKWSIVASANPRGATYAALESVSCSAGNKCFAVGHTQSGGVGINRPLIERWNGKTFTTVTSPAPAGATDTPLLGVNCRTAVNCFAVGRTNGSALVEHWNGEAWTVAATPDFGVGAPELVSVSCPTATRCVAVGTYSDSRANSRALVVAWDGTSWLQLTSDDPPDRESRLLDVSCPSATACVAVGLLRGASQSSEATFVEHLAGNTWSRVASPNPDRRGNAANVLGGVACPAVKSCFAVGSASSAKVAAPIMHWKGKRWALAAHPNPK